MATADILHRRSTIREALREAGLFAASLEFSTASSAEEQATPRSWRIGTTPLLLTPDQASFFVRLGPQLVSFYRALNRLYQESAKKLQPQWVARFLDQGKPEGLIAYGRMKRFRDDIPTVIRPDVIPTSDGMVITELDSVPGGIGLTACLARIYGQEASGKGPEDGPTDSSPSAFRPSPLAPRLFDIVGGPDGMVRGFAAMLEHHRSDRSGCIAIVVSEEAKDYRPEMSWMAAQLRRQGMDVSCVEPRELTFTEEGLRLPIGDREAPISVVYRFYELFDLPNIPKSELVQYAAKKDWVTVTPPYKPALEEKSSFALLHHPVLRSYWQRELGEETFLHLTSVMPRTWVLDPSPIPPAATIPDLSVGNRAVNDWLELAKATQKERHFVIKPSGFSELAWGSRGVSVGHDLPQTEWTGAIERALSAFPRTPYVLQEFHKGRHYPLDYFDSESGEIRHMDGRVRLSPYYFVAGEKVELAGILATVVPADKKVIHGMKDAIMIPCAIAPQ